MSYKCSCCKKLFLRKPRSMIPFGGSRSDEGRGLGTRYYKFYLLCRKCANKEAFGRFVHSCASDINSIYRQGLIDTAKVCSDNDTVTTAEGHMEVLLYILNYDATMNAIRETY